MSETTELIAQQILNGNINKRTWGDILYNVKVYGAKGDWNTVTSTGTDDTAAIQSTIDYAISVGGKAVFFPHGTYKVTALTNLSSVVLFGDNASFTGITDTISQIGNPSSNLFHNVADYGAKGDGATDETSEIQATIDAAIAAGVRSVFFSSGTYSATALANLDQVTLFGDNASLVVGGKYIDIPQFGDDHKQDTLAKIMQDIANNVATSGEFYGDSTVWGYDPATGLQVSTPAPAQMQAIIRAYHNNTAFTAVNKGVSGNGTMDVINTWKATMTASTVKFIYMNYCINDMQGANSPAITADQYKQNLRYMVETAQRSGKIVVLETPNPVMANGSNGTPAKAEGVKQFADVMRQVAVELNVPLVDSYKMFEEYFSQGVSVANTIPDGIHPNQAAYKLKGQLMASILLSPVTNVIDGPKIIPSVSPGVQASGGANVIAASSGSKTGYGRIANKIRILINVKQPGLDIYVATPVWSGGTSSCAIVVDTVTVATVSLNDSALATNFAVDQEIMVMENASPGFHLIELNATGTTDAGLYYVRSHPTRAKTTYAGTDSGTAPTATARTDVLTNTDIAVSGAAGQHHLLFDKIPVSRVLKSVDIEVKATFGGEDGFLIFAHPVVNSSATPRGGLLVYLNGTTGFLTVGEGTETGYTLTTIGAADLRAVNKTYRVTVSTSGAVTFYVDGVQVGTYTQTKAHIGGFVGFYKQSAGSFRIERVSLN